VQGDRLENPARAVALLDDAAAQLRDEPRVLDLRSRFNLKAENRIVRRRHHQQRVDRRNLLGQRVFENGEVGLSQVPGRIRGGLGRR